MTAAGQAINSLCPYPCNSLFDLVPDAQSSIIWKILLPTSSMVYVPSMMPPQLMSMSSCCRFQSVVSVASLREGVDMKPNAEPLPVVNQIRLAPPATWPVTVTGRSPECP